MIALLGAAVVDREIDLHEVVLVRLHRRLELRVLILEAAGDARCTESASRSSTSSEQRRQGIRAARRSRSASGRSDPSSAAGTTPPSAPSPLARSRHRHEPTPSSATKYLSRFLSSDSRRPHDLLGPTVRRGRVDARGRRARERPEAYRASGADLFGRGVLIDDGGADADDWKRLAGGWNWRAESALRLVTRRFQRERWQAIEREQRAGADAELEGVATERGAVVVSSERLGSHGWCANSTRRATPSSASAAVTRRAGHR